MGSIAGTLIRGASQRVVGNVITGAGVTAGAAAAADAAREARKRQEEANKARSSPVARTDAQSKAKTDDCSKEEKCKDCPPDHGSFMQRSTNGWSRSSIEYQARICGLPVGIDTIQEWSFNDISFDGFDSSECLLKEAKAKYDQFMNDWGTVKKFFVEGADKLIDEAMRQGAKAVPRPPTRLRWYFMQPLSYRYFSLIIQKAHPDVEVVFHP